MCIRDRDGTAPSKRRRVSAREDEDAGDVACPPIEDGDQHWKSGDAVRLKGLTRKGGNFNNHEATVLRSNKHFVIVKMLTGPKAENLKHVARGKNHLEPMDGNGSAAAAAPGGGRATAKDLFGDVPRSDDEKVDEKEQDS